MQFAKSVGVVLFVCGICMCTAAFAGVNVGKLTGGVESFMVDGKEIKLPATGGGFNIYDAAAKKNVELADGSVNKSGDKTVFSCQKKGDIKLTAQFIDKGQYVLVSGELENLKGGERGIALSYTIPAISKDAIFSNDLKETVKLSDTEVEGNVYPVAAMCGSDSAIAMAIPPSSPCEFGVAGSSKGLSVHFYLGIMPETKNFPNKAAFALIIYPVDGKWGFRSAMSKYYSFYPDYYTNRLDHGGLYMCPRGSGDGNEAPEPSDLQYFGLDTLETAVPWFEADLARDKKYDILSLPYMIVGMREVKYLKTLPQSYDEAMKAFANWTIKDNEGHPITKENEAGGRDENLRIEADSSTCFTADGKYAIQIRYTPWGKNSVTFKTNPNPYLFEDTNNQCVGRFALNRIAYWCKKYPKVDGVTIDSLGANWPANFNYRKDHFKYARYPLTCDPNGRVCLHNEISHYEFLEALDKQLRSNEGKKLGVVANGIYTYIARPEPAQHYKTGTNSNRTRLGRFFLASLLDFACSEPGISSPTESLEFMRVSMGKKVYSATNARWTDQDKVNKWINSCLCYGLFGVNQLHYGDKIEYYYPEVYKRDKALFDWFVPKCRLLSKAGWEPVTYAKASGEKVFVERYGSGNTVYFTLLNQSESDQKCAMTIDLASLGFKPDEYSKSFTIEEIAQSAPITNAASGKIELTLKPYKTCIIAVRKK